MAINVSQAFKRTSANPIDETIALTKAQMLTINDNVMPAYYFTICQDDGDLYMYDKSATASLTTGKFSLFAGGEATPYVYATSEALSTTINGTVTLDYADMSDINGLAPTTADLTAGKTLVRDDAGTIGVVTAVNDADSEATITTATTTYDKDISFIAPAYDPTATYDAGDVVTYDGKRYVADVDIDPAEDPFDPTHWVEEDVQTAIEAVSGNAKAKYNYTTNIEVGGVPVGTEVKSTDLLADIVKKMLVTTYYPTYTAPSATLAYTANTYVEVGSTLAAATGTVTYNAGAITLQGVKQNDRGGAATKYYLSTVGADTEYSADSTSSGAFNVSALTRSTKGTIVLTGKVDFAQGPQPKDSDGNDYETPLAAGSVTATKTINFIQPFFYGVSDTFAVSTLNGLTKSVTAKSNKTFSFTTNNQFMVFAYDSSYGNLSSILDPNSFETISGWTKSTLTYNGFSYNVYVANAATTDTGAAYTFKF